MGLWYWIFVEHLQRLTHETIALKLSGLPALARQILLEPWA